MHQWAKFWLSILILKVQRTIMSLKSWLWLWRTLEVPDWGLESWFGFWYGHKSLLHLYSKFWLFFLILKVQRTSISLKSWFWASENCWNPWLGFWILIFIWIYSLIFYTPMIQLLAIYLDFEVAKNIHVLKVLIWALENAEGSWLGFGILILIWIWLLLVFDTPMIWILAL